MKRRHAIAVLIALVMGISQAVAESHRTIIDAATAKAMHERGVLFVDVRSDLSFQLGHIPGAVNLDVRKDDFVTRFQQAASPADPIVIYCRGMDCSRSSEAILLLHPLGYDNLYYFQAGMPGWETAGYPVSR